VTAPASAERRRAGRRGAGFTLIELLVSMVVLALVMVSIMSGLRFVIRAFAATDMRREALEELTLGFSVLRGELERAEPLMRKVRNRDFVLFEGGPERVRFVNVEPPYLAGLPFVAFEYAIVPDSGAYRIELRRAPLDPARPDLAAVEGSEPRVLLRTPQALQFTYFGQLKERERPGWHAEWPTGQRLPQAVRLAYGDEPGWPELVVPLRIRVPWYCGTPEPQNTAGCATTPEEERRLAAGREGAAGERNGLGESGSMGEQKGFGERDGLGSGGGFGQDGGFGSSGGSGQGGGLGERRP
jgi:general secretion pathway protein J